MIASTRLSSVVQVAGVATAALLCYLVSQSVASERAALTKVDRQIAREQDAIAKLGTEVATRSRLTQIENWNRQLALQAPRPSQYVDNGVQLASLYAHDAGPQLRLDPAIARPHGPIEQVSLPAVGSAPLVAPRAPTAAPVPPVPVLPPIARGGVVMAAFHPAASPKVAKAPAALLPDPLLRTAALVRPKASRLDDEPAAVQQASFQASPLPLLSADIAGLAKAEQSKRGSGGVPK